MSVEAYLPALPRLEQLTAEQLERLDTFGDLLAHFNRGVNLVSRESVFQIKSQHIPHALAIGLLGFHPGAQVVDWGTGGGIPSIPLAIAFPQTRFVAVDSIQKKTLAVQTMARRLGLENLVVWNGDAARWPGTASHSVSRATAPLATLWHWHTRIAEPTPRGSDLWAGGLICLKGGDLSEEVQGLQAYCEKENRRMPAVQVVDLAPLFADPYFETKRMVHLTDDQH